MEPSQLEFNLFIRRWQVRLFIAAFTLPALMIVFLAGVLRMEADVIVISGGMLCAAFLLTCLLLQLWRIEKRRPSRKMSRELDKGKNAGRVTSGTSP